MEVILEHKGEVTFDTIDLLLAKLKALPAYTAMSLSLRKRIYSIFVECVENINKHTIPNSVSHRENNRAPYINLINEESEYVISTGNIIRKERIDQLKNRLELINQMDKEGLKASYTYIVDKELLSEEDGSGLGLITIGLKSKNKIHYDFSTLNEKYSFFEMKISV